MCSYFNINNVTSSKYSKVISSAHNTNSDIDFSDKLKNAMETTDNKSYKAILNEINNEKNPLDKEDDLSTCIIAKNDGFDFTGHSLKWVKEFCGTHSLRWLVQQINKTNSCYNLGTFPPECNANIKNAYTNILFNLPISASEKENLAFNLDQKYINYISKNTDAALISSVKYLLHSNQNDKNILSSTEYENTKLLLNSVLNILNGAD